MAILKTVTSLIVYTPLVLVCLTVLYGIGYGVWHYKYNPATIGQFPPSYQAAGRTFLYVLKQIIKPIIALGQALWWLIPLFPERFRQYYGWGPEWGAWSSDNKTTTLGILAFISVITISSLVLKYGYPKTIVGYNQFFNVTLIILAIILIAAKDYIFNINCVGN